jgi:competence protein ComFC
MGLVDWLYPKKCVGCGKKGGYGCDSCLKKVQPRDEQSDNCMSIFEYQGLIKKMILRLKFSYLRDLEKELEKLIDWGLDKQINRRVNFRFKDFINKKPVIQPVSLHWKRENWRGFNQSELIARVVGKKLSLREVDVLVRQKQTRSQVGLKKEERSRNIKDAFEVKRFNLPEKILLIDDVWTTGSTMKASVKTLKKKGVGEIWGLTLAR